MLRAIKIRLYPTTEQQRLLRIQFGCARYVWNDALAKTREAYHQTGKSLRWSELSARLPQMKRDLPWLAEADAQVLQQSLANLAAAFEAFFHKRAHYPRFKSKHNRQSIRYPQRNRIDGNRIRLGKIGMVACVVHRIVDNNEIRSVTVSRGQDNRYYASVLVEDNQQIPDSSNEGQAIGIDVGLVDLAVTSDGSHFTNPRHLNRATRNLKRKQQSLSRKKKGSKSRNRARLLVARAYAHVAACRRDYTHKLSRKIVDENQVIVFESLNVKGMLQNPNLARSIGDAGWGMFKNFCVYKAAWSGKTVISVDRWFPSTKTCNGCGHITERLDLSTRAWTCPNCAAEHDRDVNAAKNIRDEGLRMLSAGRTPAAATGGCVSRDDESDLVIRATADEGRSS